MGKRLTILILCLGIMAIFAWLEFNQLDIQESSCATAALAREAGAVARGWLPEFLPPSARDIRERHDLDTNAVILRFSFDPAESGFWSPACQPLDPGQVREPDARLAAGVSWWPRDLFPVPGVEPRHDFFACSHPARFLAIGREEPLALSWNAPGTP